VSVKETLTFELNDWMTWPDQMLVPSIERRISRWLVVMELIKI
jgi:hypothetical protein